MKLTIEINSIAELYELGDMLKKLPLIPMDGLTIASLALTVRCENCLKAEQIDTVEKLLSYTPNDLLKTPNLGRRELENIKIALAKRGLKLRGE